MRRALQLINAALDISALFDARRDVVSRATRFTSKAPPGRILDALERSITAHLGGTVKRRGDSTRCAQPGRLPPHLPRQSPSLKSTLARSTSQAPPGRILNALERSITTHLGGTVKRRGDSTRCASPAEIPSRPQGAFSD